MAIYEQSRFKEKKTMNFVLDQFSYKLYLDTLKIQLFRLFTETQCDNANI